MRDLSSLPGIEPRSLQWKHSFNHWASREVPGKLRLLTAFIQSPSNSPRLVNPKSALLSESVYVFVLEI